MFKFFLLLFSVCCWVGLSVAQPTIILNPVSSVTSTGATFTGTISADGSPVTNRVLLGLNASVNTDSAGTIPGNQSSKITGTNISVTRTYPGSNNNPPKLTPNTMYFYAMGAKDDLGRYTRSEVLSFTTPDLFAPDSLSAEATAVSETAATINWSGQSEHVQVRYSTSAFPGTATDGTSLYSGSAGEFAATGLTDSTTYFIRAFGKASASATYTANSKSLVLSTDGSSGHTGTTIPASYEGRIIPGSSGLILDFTDNENSTGFIKTFTTDSYPTGDFPATALSPSGSISVSQWAPVVWQLDFGVLEAITWNLTIDLAQIAGATDPSGLAVLYRASESDSWSSLADGATRVINNPTTGLLSVTGLTEDGYFTLASDGSSNSLPVELAHFNGENTGSAILLTWETVSETDNAGFYVERKNLSSASWKTLGFVPGAGTTTNRHRYQYSDQVSEGSFHYRLRQTNLDGTGTFSHELEVFSDQPVQFSLDQNYPNPFNPETVIRYQVSEIRMVRLEVFDLNGKSVLVLVNGRQNPGTYSIPFRGLNLSSGVYYYVLTAGNQSLTRKMTLLR